MTTFTRGAEALKTLRERRDDFDIVLSDVHMPDMDGFKLLEHIALELDVPVMSACPPSPKTSGCLEIFPSLARRNPTSKSSRSLSPSGSRLTSPPRLALVSAVMSANCATDVVLRGIIHGAVDYLLKPVRIEELRNIWQHVVRRRRDTSAQKDDSGGDSGKPAASGSSGEGSKGTKGSGGKKETKSKKGDEVAAGKKRGKKDRDDDGAGEENEDASTLKKPRVVWSAELHQQFVTAVNQLGIDKAVPKRILDLMGVQGLTRENVASHLQKYRLYLKRLQGVNSGGGGATGGSGFMTGLTMDGGANVMGPGVGRAGSPAVGGPGGAPGMVMGGPMDPSMAGGVMQPAGMMSGGMMYATGARMAPGPNGMMPKGAPGGQMGGQPYIMAGGPNGGMHGSGQPIIMGPGMGGVGPGGMMGPGGLQGGQIMMGPGGFDGGTGPNGSYGNLNMGVPGGHAGNQGGGIVMMPQGAPQMMPAGVDGFDGKGFNGGAPFNVENGAGGNLVGPGDIGDEVLDMFLKDGLPEGDGF